MPTVYDLTRDQLTERLVAWGEPRYRADQVWSQLWKRAATYDAMSDVSPALRERLASELPIGVEVLDERAADRGATRKALLRLGGAHVIEAVLMGYRDRVTVCVSSQAGCAMGCTFCATGQMGLRNNLTAGEVAAQVVWARREAARLPSSTPRRLGNVVFMGMGEPLANERHVFGSIAMLADRAGFGMGAGADRSAARGARQPDPAEPDAGLPRRGIATGADPAVRLGVATSRRQCDRPGHARAGYRGPCGQLALSAMPTPSA